ncbi:MAG: LysR family transcriptional regulator [Pseudomonadota bacterium]
MNWNTVSFDWNQARAFLVTAEEGSLSAAARALGLTQPTLGRQVTALEESLGVTLFERVGRTLTLTQPGLELLDHVRGMGEAAGRFSLAASGQSQTIEGHVSLTATNMMATFHLPPVFKKIREMAPEIELEILASSEVRDLRRREADIAIRHGRPEHPELIAKLVGETTAHLYAATSHLDAVGRPKHPDDIANWDFIGFGDPMEYLPYLTDIGLPLTRENFKTTTNSGTVILALMRQGFGTSMLTKQDADMAPDIEQILPDLPPIPIPVWLVTHRELHTSRRIRLVFDLLAEEIPKLS